MNMVGNGGVRLVLGVLISRYYGVCCRVSLEWRVNFIGEPFA